MVLEVSKNGHGPVPEGLRGYVVPPDTAVLRWPAGSPYHGAVVKCRRYASVEVALELDRAVAEKQPPLPDGAGAEDLPPIYRAIWEFGCRVLLAWNLTEPHPDPDAEPDELGDTPNLKDGDGNDLLFPIPATPEAVMNLPRDFAMALVVAHQREVMGIPAPLSPPSNGGVGSGGQGPSIPRRERRSRNRGNSSGPK